MVAKTISDRLWGQQARFAYVMVAAVLLLCAFLGARELWTQEHRWADIVTGMFYRHDFLHPFLGNADYYDKPLLSYWLMAGLSFLTGEVTTWTLRLPSVLAGLLAIGSIYQIGYKLKDKQLGLLAAWMLLTTYYFIFWAKTSSADMLNLGGTLFAVAWYFTHKPRPSFFSYSIFFLIVALTALCKGLIGAVVPVLVLLPDLLRNNEWKRHVSWSFLLSMLPAAVVYVLPFWASSYFGGTNYGENGLYLVYRENILRYFQPFDHKGPIYTYFLYLPLYLMPWIVFFIPALCSLPKRWKALSPESKWMCWSVLILFLFLTLSGSRRNYYVLPLVPFAILMTADWIVLNVKRSVWAGRLALSFYMLLFILFDLVQPLYYAQGGIVPFSNAVKQQLSTIKPLQAWHFVLLDPEMKVSFYLQLAPTTPVFDVLGSRTSQTESSLAQSWLVLKQQPDAVFITRKLYEPVLRKLLPTYQVIEATPTLGERVLGIDNQNAPVAFIPKDKAR